MHCPLQCCFLALQVASMDRSMGQYASRIMLQGHRQEILVASLKPLDPISCGGHYLSPQSCCPCYLPLVQSLVARR